MTSVLRRILPSEKDDDYSVEYSFAMEYDGPPISHEIPHLIPIDIRRIPTAAVASSAIITGNLSLPVIQPIVKSQRPLKNPSQDSKPPLGNQNNSNQLSGISDIEENHGDFKAVSSSGEVGETSTSTSTSTSTQENKSLVVTFRDFSSSSSDTLGFSDNQNYSNQLSISSDIDELPHHLNEQSTGEVIVTSGQETRAHVVTFVEPSSADTSDLDKPEPHPARPIAPDEKKGLCYKCRKTNRFSEKEICIVCGARYCVKCLLRAMGSMPEGRKCVTCVGFPIDESKRGLLGKRSRMLKKLFTDGAIKQIMSDEISCEVNQLPPDLVCVNGKHLSIEELVALQRCANPPKNVRPGRYWYDKVSGYWGKEGEKPCQIISPHLDVGYQVSPDASNGNTNVLMNNREITKPELWMLQAAGIHCEGNPHFWVTADGSCQHEGMGFVIGKLWEKTRVKLVCTALSLPLPSGTAGPGGEDADKDAAKVNSKNFEQKMVNKMLLVGCDQSGTSTIFKQAKILYKIPFTEDEKESIKFMIQRNLYSYIAILLEGQQCFEEEHLIETKSQGADEPGPSGNSEKNIYSLSPKLKAFASWLLKIMISGNLEAIFPAATREYSPLVEELWKDKAFQATYIRRNELIMLPRVANYFLDRAVEISRVDYEPSEMDILYAEGMTSSNGVASIEFSFPRLSQDGYMESSDNNDPAISYQLIRVHTSTLGKNCKFLEMFEDVDLVIYCVSLTDYDEYHEDLNGSRTNKMLAAKKHFEKIASHPTLCSKDFLLVLNKYDLLEEKIERVPLTKCDWFQDFLPVISQHPNSTSSNNTPLAQRAFHYVAFQFKKLFDSITGRKLFVARVTGLEADSVDKAIKYGKEILKWEYERQVVSMNEWSTESMEQSTST